MSQMNPNEIERWFPKNLHQVAGCSSVVKYFTKLLEGPEIGSNTFLYGPSRSGKSAIVKAYLRSLMCGGRDPITQLPCEKCNSCLKFNFQSYSHGVFAEFEERVRRFKMIPANIFWVDCTKTTATDLAEVVDGVRESNGIKLVFLDEVHRLQERGLASSLLLPLEDLPAMWVASTNHPKPLTDAFKHRFSTKLKMTPPTIDQLVDFIRQRCQEWEIVIDDQSKTPELLAQRSRRIVSASLSCLAQAVAHNQRQLTYQLVNDFTYFLDDEPEED